MLARQPRSGYDLLGIIERPMGFFWHARRSQIYPELARLEAGGLVRHTLVEQRDRPDKKVYSITEIGLAELRRWVTEPMDLPPERDEFMVKIFSLWLADPAEALALVKAHEGYHAARLATYEKLWAQGERVIGGEPLRVNSPDFATRATLRRGIEYERGYVAWCRWVIEALEAGAASEAPETGPAM